MINETNWHEFRDKVIGDLKADRDREIAIENAKREHALRQVKERLSRIEAQMIIQRDLENDRVGWFTWGRGDSDMIDIRETDGPPALFREMKWYLIRTSAGVYAPRELLEFFIETQWYEGPYISLKSGRKMFKVTPELIKRARKNNAYPRRNDRERAVQARNEAALDQLEELIS